MSPLGQPRPGCGIADPFLRCGSRSARVVERLVAVSLAGMTTERTFRSCFDRAAEDDVELVVVVLVVAVVVIVEPVSEIGQPSAPSGDGRRSCRSACLTMRTILPFRDFARTWKIAVVGGIYAAYPVGEKPPVVSTRIRNFAFLP